MILVTACHPIEARWISRRPEVRIVRTAAGDRSSVALERQDDGAFLLLATGFCGGADPALRVGDLVLADAVCHHGREIPIDPALVDRARRRLAGGPGALQVGRVASADRVLGPDDKRALAADGFAAVDMESGPLARWAAERRIPFLALRAVVDAADDDLTFLSNRSVITTAVRRPRALMRTACAARTAGRALGSAVDQVLDAWEGAGDA